MHQVHDEYTPSRRYKTFGNVTYGNLETSSLFLELCLFIRLRGILPDFLNTRVIRRE